MAVRSGFLFNLFFRLKEFVAYPVSVYGVFVQSLLIFGVPLAFINYYPAAYLLAKDITILPVWGPWIALAAGPVCFWFGYLFWMLGADRYQGAEG